MFEHSGEAWRGLMMKKHPKAQGETRVEKGLGKLEVGLEEVVTRQYCSIPNLLICISCFFVLSAKIAFFPFIHTRDGVKSLHRK